MHILSVVGARPQFVKAAMVAEAVELYNSNTSVQQRMIHTLVHTGQHYDPSMSEVFFEQLAIPAPKHNLSVGSGTHAAQTAMMLERIESLLNTERPDLVIAYGDTNSTLAGALASVKLGIPVAHVEAGLRSFNRSMPEEINRLLCDHMANFLFCPTETAVTNLKKEGIVAGVSFSGDVMLDAVLKWRNIARSCSHVLEQLAIEKGSYALLTLHRAENTNSVERLAEVLEALLRLSFPVVFPMHPRTRAYISSDPGLRGLEARMQSEGNIRVTEPVSYLDMLALQDNARLVMTDSGGVQKEAYFLGVPCLTLRGETEWTETLVNGWNRLTGTDGIELHSAASQLWQLNGHGPRGNPDLTAFGMGNAATNIVNTLASSRGRE